MVVAEALKSKTVGHVKKDVDREKYHDNVVAIKR